MNAPLYNQDGKEIGVIDLPEDIFGLKPNADLIHQALVAQEANRRQPLAHTKGRGDVRGGGIKPWRQKGTGRARHGSIRSPIWKGGGVTFGPTKERNFTKKINKKMKQKALLMALSSKAQMERMLILDSLSLGGKTKEAMQMIKKLSANLKDFRQGRKNDSIIFVVSGDNQKTAKAIRNLPFAFSVSPKSLNIEDTMTAKYLVLTKDSIPQIKETNSAFRARPKIFKA